MTGLDVFNELVRRETDECVLWPMSDCGVGYGQVNVNGKTLRVHQLACEYRHGPRPERHDAAHCRPDGSPCVSRLCMNPRHLEWKTRAENVADTVRHGTQTRGTASRHAKLTEADVHEIRRVGGSPSLLAQRFGICESSVRDVLNRRTWKWLPELEQVAS